MRRMSPTQVRSFQRRQQGVVLFIALIALVVILLAAVALVRSVDTSSLIAGNVAFRRAATSSADTGFERARDWLFAQQTAESAAGRSQGIDAEHALNGTNRDIGFYANLDPANDLIANPNTWTDGFSRGLEVDGAGNTIRYIIQRMCRTAGQVPTPTDCIYSDAENKNNSQAAGGSTAVHISGSVMYRVTVRVSGPRNTISYIQGFIY